VRRRKVFAFGLACAVVAALSAASSSIASAAPPTHATASAVAQASAAPRPAVAKVFPSAGTGDGGTQVTITGKNFSGVGRVLFGSTAGTAVKVESSTRLLVTTPRHLAGAVSVTVDTTHGDSEAVTAGRFSFAAPPEAIKWGPWKQVVGGDADNVSGGAGNLSGLGCLTTTHCFAWDVKGDRSDLLSWNGSSWSQPEPVALTGGPWTAMADTSCPTSTFCVTVGGVGNAYVYSGGTWTSTATGGAQMLHVSCVSATFCAATDSHGEVYRYNGKTWTAGVRLDDATSANDSVSCVSADFCLLGTGGDKIFSWNGASWTQTAPDLSGVADGLQVSCTSTTWCVAVDGDFHFWTYNGVSWQAPFRAGSEPGEHLRCTSETFCTMGTSDGGVVIYEGAGFGDAGDVFNVSYYHFGVTEVSCVGQWCLAVAEVPGMVALSNTFSLNEWSAATQRVINDSGTLNRVNCPTTTFCAAIGVGAYDVTRQRVYVETWEHGTWTTPVLLPTAVLPYPITGVHELDLSCPSATFCLADAAYGPVWRYNGRTWAAIGSPPSAAPGVTGLSCASATFCLATVSPSVNSENKPTSSALDSFNGSRWTVVRSWAGDTNRWQDVTCPSSHFCLLSDDYGHVATFNGTTGRQLKVPALVANAVYFTCTSADFCVTAVDATPNVPGSNSPDKSGVLMFNGKSWTYHYLATGGIGSGGVVDEVSCAPHSTFCIARTAAGRTFSYDGFQWSQSVNIGAAGPVISCASSKLCAAVNNSGDAAIGT
jgi:IPT/TIG domain